MKCYLEYSIIYNKVDDLVLSSYFHLLPLVFVLFSACSKRKRLRSYLNTPIRSPNEGFFCVSVSIDINFCHSAIFQFALCSSSSVLNFSHAVFSSHNTNQSPTNHSRGYLVSHPAACGTESAYMSDMSSLSQAES